MSPRRASPPASAAPSLPTLVWDDGLHLEGSILWFDAPRQRDLCFLSHAGVRPQPAHHTVLASPATVTLLNGGPEQAARRLPCPFFRPFCLGELELELLPAGYLAGSALLLVTWRGTKILYAGAVGRNPAPQAEALRIRRCDLLLLACPLGDPALSGPPPAQVRAELVAFASASLAAGRPPVLFVDEHGIGPEVIGLLNDAGLPVRSSRALTRRAARYGELGYPLAVTEHRGALRADAVLVWPREQADAQLLAVDLPRARRASVGEAALLDPAGERARLGVEALFPLTRHATHAELLALVEAADPRQVLLIGGRTETFARALADRGRAVGTLLPPRQGSLLG